MPSSKSPIADKELVKRLGKFGTNTYIIDTVIDRAYPELIEIGDNCIITGATILTHNSCTRTVCDGFGQIGKVIIGNNVAICYGSMLLCGTVVGDRSIIAAGAVVLSGTIIPSDEIWGGVPAKRICSIVEYIEIGLKKMAQQKEEGWQIKNLQPGQVFQYRLATNDIKEFGYMIDENALTVKKNEKG